jgi:2TM domain
LNFLTGREHVWFVWPMLGWGIAVLMHGLGAFVFGPGGPLYDRLLDRERRHDI